MTSYLVQSRESAANDAVAWNVLEQPHFTDSSGRIFRMHEERATLLAAGADGVALGTWPSISKDARSKVVVLEQEIFVRFQSGERLVFSIPKPLGRSVSRYSSALVATATERECVVIINAIACFTFGLFNADGVAWILECPGTALDVVVRDYAERISVYGSTGRKSRESGMFSTPAFGIASEWQFDLRDRTVKLDRALSFSKKAAQAFADRGLVPQYHYCKPRLDTWFSCMNSAGRKILTGGIIDARPDDWDAYSPSISPSDFIALAVLDIGSGTDRITVLENVSFFQHFICPAHETLYLLDRDYFLERGGMTAIFAHTYTDARLQKRRQVQLNGLPERAQISGGRFFWDERIGHYGFIELFSERAPHEAMRSWLLRSADGFDWDAVHRLDVSSSRDGIAGAGEAISE